MFSLFCSVLFCRALKISQCPATAAGGITAKSGPQIDQSNCTIRQNECSPYNKNIYLINSFFLVTNYKREIVHYFSYHIFQVSCNFEEVKSKYFPDFDIKAELDKELLTSVQDSPKRKHGLKK